MPDFLPGDIGLCAPNGSGDIPGQIIVAAEVDPDKCPRWACHAWICDSTTTLIEAAVRVQQCDISKYTSTGSQPSLVLRVRSLTDEQRLDAADRARTLLTQSYGFGDILADGADSVLSWFARRDVVVFRRWAPYRTERDCSVLVAKCLYDAAGWAFCRLPTQAVEPSNICCDYLERPGEYQVVFCSDCLRKYLP